MCLWLTENICIISNVLISFFYFSCADKNRVAVRCGKLFRSVAPWFGGHTNDGAHENRLRRHKTVGARIQSNKLHASGIIILYFYRNTFRRFIELLQFTRLVYVMIIDCASSDGVERVDRKNEIRHRDRQQELFQSWRGSSAWEQEASFRFLGSGGEGYIDEIGVGNILRNCPIDYEQDVYRRRQISEYNLHTE